MKSKSFEGMVCSIAGVLEAVGDRWAVLDPARPVARA